MPDLPDLVPESGGQDGLHRLKQRAEVPLPQPQCQGDAIAVQYRPSVQDRQQGLEPLHLFTWRPGQNNALTGAVAPAEGHGDPDAGYRRFQQLRGNQVVIGLVNGIGRGAHRDFHDLSGFHASPLLLLLCLFLRRL